MGRKLYVGNLSYDVTDSALEQMCAQFGTVESAQVIMDRDAGRSKGFGFVEMKTDQEAQAAIAGLNGQQSGGRSLTVNEAKPREDRGGQGGGRPLPIAWAGNHPPRGPPRCAGADVR
jgi:RNA recognition motif-containing protein